MKVLVTGANGYLGRGVVEKLLDMGHEVIAADFSINDIDERAKRNEVNLFSIDDPFAYFGKPDAVIHMAWRDGFAHYSNAHIEDLPNHFSFLSKLCESGLKSISVIGSMHEVGFYEGCISENTPCHPTTPYGISKNALRQLTEMLALKNCVSAKWLRGYYIVGNNTKGASIFSKLAAAAIEGKNTFPFTLGQNQYDFIDYEDFCRQVALASTQNEIDGVIEICSGHPEKLADRVERFIKENGFDITLDYGAFPDRPYDSKAVWGSSMKIAQILDK